MSAFSGGLSLHFPLLPNPTMNIPWQTLPFFGVVPAVLDESGEELEGEAEGYLVRKSEVFIAG